MEDGVNRQSKIWVHFKPIEKNDQDKSYTECKIDGCNEKLVYHNTTSSMIKHVKWKHPEKYSEFENKCSSAKKQTTLNSEGFKINPLSSDKMQAITNAIGKFIAIDMRPLNTIEGKGFQEMISILEPRYILPSFKNYLLKRNNSKPIY